MANETKMVYGSQVTVVSVAANVASAGVAGGTADLDNSVNLYPWAQATLFVNSWSVAPTDKSTVNLYAVLQDVDGTLDDTAAPSSSDVKSARFMGAFPIFGTTTTEQRATITISLEGLQKAKFYVENKTGQQIVAGSGTELTVKIKPFTYAPA